MLYDLLLDPRCQRIISALARHGPMRFTPLARATGLDNKTLSDRLSVLRDAMVVGARTVPTRGERVWLEYSLSRRGRAMYAALEEMWRTLISQSRVMPQIVADIQDVAEGTR